MLFKRELKINLKAFIICTVICAALSFYVIALIPSLGADMQKLVDLKFPKQMQLAFGMNNLDFHSPVGIYAIIFSYLYLTFGIFAAGIFGSIVVKEFNKKTAEYLFSLPAKRLDIIRTKLIVAFLYLTASILITIIISWIGFAAIIKTGYDFRIVLLMGLACWIGSLFFGSLAFLLSSFFTKTRMAVGLVLGTYLLQVVTSLNEELHPIKYFSPFDWFKGSEIVNQSGLSIVYSSIAILSIVICFTLGCKRFIKKDVLV